MKLNNFQGDLPNISDISQTKPGAQVFEGSAVHVVSERLPVWEAPLQVHAALAAPNTVACVLLLPHALIREAVQTMERMQTISIMNKCCRVSSFRHISVSELARLAKYATVCYAHLATRHHCFHFGQNIA